MKKVFLMTMAMLTLVSCTIGNHSSSSYNDASSNSGLSSNENSSDSYFSSISSEIVSSGDSSSSEISSDEGLTLKSQSEVLSILKSSPFSSKIKTNDLIGLEKISDVGVDKTRFDNEILYPVPNEGTVYIAEDYGITQDSDANTGTLSLLLKEIKSVEGNKIIKFKKGVYYFSGKVDITGISDLYLVGEEGTEFVYKGWTTYFEAKASKNVHISNISFDMLYSPTISGTIKSYNESDTQSTIVLSIPDEFDLTNSLYTNWQGTTCSYMECYYDSLTGSYVPDRNANLFYNSPTSSNNKGVESATYNSNTRELTIVLNYSFPYCSYRTPKIGTNVSFAYTMYENHGLYFYQCENVYLENVNVYVSGGMGFRVDEGKNVYLNRVNYMNREGSKRIMTCTADIIHTAALEGDLRITNSILEASHDDALNIKSFYTVVSSVSASAKEIEVKQTQSEVLISYEIGDTIDIYSKETMGLVDTYTITDVYKSGSNYTLTVDRRPKNVEIGQNVGNVTKSTKMELDNCIIRNKRNRGILLQARNSSITNCTFQNVVMGAIQVLSVYDSFREGIVPQNITLNNNKFINNNADISVFAYGASGGNHSVPSTIKNVEISNNYFYNGKGTNINLLAVGNCNVLNNLFDYTELNTLNIIYMKLSNSITLMNNLLITPHTSSINFLEDNGDVTDVKNTNNVATKGAN